MNSNDRMLNIEEVLVTAQLPALSQTAIRLLHISQDPHATPAEFAAPIESDVGLASQVVRFANSSYFGFGRKIACVKQAVALVGMRTIKNFVLWNAVFSQVPDPSCSGFRLKQLWADSLRRALFARMLAALLGSKAADDAFTAALLQDMAIPLLAGACRAQYARMFELRDDEGKRISAMELECFGWTHAEAAERLARNWNLPERFALAVGSHLHADQWLDEPAFHPVELSVAMSALLPSGADMHWTECEELEDHFERLVLRERPSFPSMLERVDAESGRLASFMQVGDSGLSLQASYEHAVSRRSVDRSCGQLRRAAGPRGPQAGGGRFIPA